MKSKQYTEIEKMKEKVRRMNLGRAERKKTLRGKNLSNRLSRHEGGVLLFFFFFLSRLLLCPAVRTRS